jgi:hypothetical protein
VAGLALIALACVAFLPAVWSGFVSDDFLLLHNLRRSGGIGWAFSHNDAGEAGAAGHFYRPAWTLWNLWIFKAFGASTTAFHVGSLVLYALVAVEVFVLAASFVDRSRAWIAAAAFAVYPRHGESVSWVSASTDLVAVAAALGALLFVRSRLPLWARACGMAVLTAAATLGKEVAFVLPLLVLLVVRRRRSELVLPAVALAVEAGVFAARYAVIGGFGGYSGYRWTPLHALGSAASYALAAATPPSVPVFRYWVVLVVPAAIVVIVAWRLRALWTRGRRRDVALVGVGAGWFLVALLPLLSLPVDLNNANGERNLLLGSVGLALALAALLPVVRASGGLVVAAALAGALALSLYSSFDWIEAGRLNDRLVPAAEALAPRGGELVLLSAPESYRTAHVFTGGDLSEVLGYLGRTDFTTAICVPVNVRELRADEIGFRANGPAYEGETHWAAPFDFPVLHSAAGLTGECAYSRLPSGPERPGLGLRALATPHPSRRPVVIAYFDGRDWKRCC